MPPLVLTPGPLEIPSYKTSVSTSWTVLGEGVAGVPAGGGESMEFVSTDNTADLSAGAGAQKVSALFLLADGSTVVVEQSMNGTSVVSLAGPGNVVALLDAWVSQYGVNDASTGDIVLRKISAGGNRATIKAGRRRAALGQFKVPLGYQFIYERHTYDVESVSGTTPLKAEVRIEAQVNPSNGSLASYFTDIDHSMIGVGRPAVIRQSAKRVIVPAGAWIRAVGKCSTAADFVGRIYGTLVGPVADPT